MKNICRLKTIRGEGTERIQILYFFTKLAGPNKIRLCDIRVSFLFVIYVHINVLFVSWTRLAFIKWSLMWLLRIVVVVVLKKHCFKYTSRLFRAILCCWTNLYLETTVWENDIKYIEPFLVGGFVLEKCVPLSR